MGYAIEARIRRTAGYSPSTRQGPAGRARSCLSRSQRESPRAWERAHKEWEERFATQERESAERLALKVQRREAAEEQWQSRMKIREMETELDTCREKDRLRLSLERRLSPPRSTLHHAWRVLSHCFWEQT